MKLTINTIKKKYNKKKEWKKRNIILFYKKYEKAIIKVIIL